MEAVELLTSGYCPFNCEYCYIPKSDKMKSLHQEITEKLVNDTFLDYLFKFCGQDLKHICLWGTEPLLTLPIIKKKLKKDKLLFMFIWIPLLFSLLMWGWNDYGLVRQTLHPTIPILIMFGFYTLYHFENKKFVEKLKYLVFFVAILECIYFGSMIHATSVEANISDISWIKEYVPDFNSSLFVSAHYLIKGFEVFNFLIFLIIIGILFYLFHMQKTLNRVQTKFRKG